MVDPTRSSDANDDGQLIDGDLETDAGADLEADAETDLEADDSEGEDEEATSLDALAAAYAGLAVGNDVPPHGQTAESDEPDVEADGEADGEADDAAPEPPTAGAAPEDEPVSPLGILEAALFVGNAENSPLTAKRIAALMRGVSPREVDTLVVELNEKYRAAQAPYEVTSHGPGYLLSIRPEYAGLRDRFYGTVREARLSQAAIDILAVIAYGQPLTREEIDETRGQPSGGMLSQLVRRRLLRIERPDEKPRRPKYYTTDRFLQIMGLEDIDELPESQEFDRNL